MVRLFILLLPILLISGCSGRGYDPRLESTAEFVDSKPHEALDSLNELEIDCFSPVNKYFYTFLKTKAEILANVPISSSEAMKNATAYFSKHNSEIYPEALLYSSRILRSDGDYPRAMECYRSALEACPATRLDLQSHILHDYSTLLGELMLYEEALAQLSIAQRIDSILNDSSRLETDRYLSLQFNEHLRKITTSDSDYIIQKALVENSFVKFIQERKTEEVLSNQKDNYEFWLLVLFFTCYGLCGVVFFLRLKNRTHRIRLREAIFNLQVLTQSLSENQVVEPIRENESEEDLREKLRKELLQLYHTSSLKTVVDARIIRSEAYNELKSCIENSEIIKENSDLWKKIEEVVLSVSPNFKFHLRLLTGGKLTSQELRTAYLIKCGVKPAQMVSLLGRTKGSISSRRELLCLKVFDEKLGTKVIDSIILSL